MLGLPPNREVVVSPPPVAVAEKAVLARLPAADRRWVSTLPPAPLGRTLTVSVGRPGLLPVAPDELIAAGYRVVGVAGGPDGGHLDVLVPMELRRTDPDWWAELVARAVRVFDLRMGPVRFVLAAELELHTGDG